MEFPLHTGYEDFSFCRPSHGPTFHSLSRTSESTTNGYSPKMPSARKLSPPEDHQRSDLEKKKTLSLMSPTTPTSPPTPPGSFRTLSPMGVRRYEVMLQEGFNARKERRAMGFTPVCRVERVPMSWRGFWKLYEAVGAGEVAHRYISIELRDEDSD